MRVLLIVPIFLWLLGSHTAQAEFSREYLDAQPLASAQVNNIEMAYRDLGNPQSPPVLMIMGLGGSHVAWGDVMVQGMIDKGYRVVLLDNRDTGGSTRFDDWGQPTFWWQLLKQRLGLEVDAPYTLNDMAKDAVSLMDELNVADAHLVGASMGGMIAQIIAVQYPERTRSLISIMSTTGSPDLPPPTPAASKSLLGTATDDAEAAERREALRARGFNLDAMGRHMMAVFKTGDRSQDVATIAAPTLVIHGEDDELLPVAHGQYTAELINGSQLVIYPGMEHKFPEQLLPVIIDEMSRHIDAVEAKSVALH